MKTNENIALLEKIYAVMVLYDNLVLDYVGAIENNIPKDIKSDILIIEESLVNLYQKIGTVETT